MRSEFVGDVVEDDDKPELKKTKSHQVEIILPTMDGLNIHIGEHVRKGDRLARKIDDHTLSLILLEHDELALSHQLAARKRREQIRLDSIAISDLKDKRSEIALKMQREASLAAAGRVPKANVDDLSQAYSQADSEILKAETSLTSLKHAHTQASQKEEIATQKLLEKEENERISQWILSPHNGEIQEVKILQTKPNHFHLRITILETLPNAME